VQKTVKESHVPPGHCKTYFETHVSPELRISLMFDKPESES
jgi:hypothetical protein